MVEAASNAPLLQCQGVRVRFGAVLALDDVSFTVPERQIVGIIGPNGAGKTTLFNCINGLYGLERGDIRFGQQSLLEVPRHRIAALGVARTFQNVALFGTQTVLQNALVGAHTRIPGGFLRASLGLGLGRVEAALHAEARDILALLELSDVAHRVVGDLPFGTRKRVELARALMSKPRLLMLDEPAAGLNHGEVAELRELVRSLAARFALTVLLVEHHMQFVMQLCDKVVAIVFGRSIAEGTPSQVQSHPEVMRAYLGEAP
ncbi:MAG: transporter related [Myxococcaceae bacterium]|nr:transporter related [Myxococcaceae bacterium]